MEMSQISDSHHRMLEATVLPDCIVECHQVSDSARGLRRVHVTKLWRTERVIGYGSSGEVLLQALDNEKEKKRALKVIRGMMMTWDECQRELTAMIEFTRPKYQAAAVFVDFYGWFQNPIDNSMYLAMEYMRDGDLEANLLELESLVESGLAIPEEDIKDITSQILEGLKIMHAERFAHRDLKPKNIFVVQRKPKWWVKLGDFGLTKRQTDGTAYRTQAGTEKYMGPEFYCYVPGLNTETDEYTNAVDIWALGCIVYRIMARAVPFPSLRSLKNYSNGNGQLHFEVPSPMAEAKAFVQELLTPHPAKRPSASAALEHSWFITGRETKTIHNYTSASPNPKTNMESQSGYNTASHLGLLSYQSPLETQNVSMISSSQWAASDPLLEPKPNVDSVQRPLSSSTEHSPSHESQGSVTRKPLPTHIRSGLKNPTGDKSQPGLSNSTPEIAALQIPTPRSPSSPIHTTEEAIPSSKYPTTEASASLSTINAPVLKSIPGTLQPEPITTSGSLDGELVASAPGNGTVGLWDSGTGVARCMLTGHSDGVWCIAFSPSGRVVASASKDKTVRLWDSGTGVARCTLTGHSDGVWCVAFSPDGRVVASASKDNTVRLWDSGTGAARCTLTGHSDGVWCVVFSPDGRVVASASMDNTVRLWDSGTGAARCTLKDHSDMVWCVAFSPDGRVVASASMDNTVRLWDSRTGVARCTLKGHSDGVWCVAFSPDGRVVASASRDKTVRLWNSRTGAARCTLKGHSDMVWCVAFSPDGRVVASASVDRTVRLWDSRTGAARCTLKGHLYGVRAIAFSPDGRVVASASVDRTVRLWDSETGVQRFTLKGHLDRVVCIAFSPGGRVVASASEDGMVGLWHSVVGY